MVKLFLVLNIWLQRNSTKKTSKELLLTKSLNLECYQKLSDFYESVLTLKTY